MSYVFGGAATDDLNLSTGGSYGADNTVALVTGWWYPTTLTATRKLWSVAAAGTVGAEIDATTSSLRLRTDNTTDGQWTVPVGFAVDEWFYFAFLLAAENTGVLAAWRVWVGRPDTAPTPATVTVATAPVGNFAGSGSFYIGNAGTGSLAFQGNIANITWLSNTASGTIPSPLRLATNGVITADEETHIYNTLVEPFWRGDYSALFNIRGPHITSTIAGWLVPLQEAAGPPSAYGNIHNSATVMPLATTGSGPAWSQVGSPRPILNAAMHNQVPRRR
jgi:hypothetical protein